MKRFTQEILDLMLTDPILYGLIAKEKSIMPASLDTVIKRNGSSINEYRIVKLVADYLGRDMESLLEQPAKTDVAA